MYAVGQVTCCQCNDAALAPHKQYWNSDTLTDVVCTTHHFPPVQILYVEGKVNMNARTESGETALTLAASQGLGNIVDYLISLPERHMDLNLKGCDGKLPELVAREAGYLKVAVAINQARERRSRSSSPTST